MPSAKRERQREGREIRMAAARAAQRKRQRWRTVRNFVLLVVAIVGIILFLSWRSGSDDKSSPTVAETACPAVDGSSDRVTTFAKAPPMCIDASKTYTATVETSKGVITIDLDAAAAPNTVNNFVVLARYHFYDGLKFHRVVPGFVDQTGDPSGSGSGGPGYTIGAELPTDANPYPIGAVAMANDNSNPSTTGSQWFIVAGTAQPLQTVYNKLGTVTAGLDVAQAINASGSVTGAPAQSVVINTVTIAES